jgi:diaminopimelate decarboxylase
MMLPARVRDLASRLDADHALPAYVYDLGALAAHAAAIRGALPRSVEFYYAVKANPDAAVLRTVAGHADGLEVSSGGELVHAAAAVPGARVAFGGPGKTFAELASAVRSGTHRFQVESPHELRMLAAAAQACGSTADVLLRVNPGGAGFGAGVGFGSGAGAGAGAGFGGAALVMGGRPSPFGMDPALLDACADVLASIGSGSAFSGSVRLRGLHAHVASGLDAGGLLASARGLLDFGRGWWAAHGVGNPEFNLGGGMAVDYRRPGSMFDWAGYGRGLAALVSPGETLRIEPGRAITAYCGWYLSRVLDVKQSHGEAFAIVAGGTHHLRTPAAKGHDQPFAVIEVPEWTCGWDRPDTGPGLVTICGQLCTPKDVLAARVPVPRLRAGDLIAFGLAGAYAWNISHHSFLMHPQPTFHYL